MNRLTHQRVNGIKSGYWSAAKKEELVQRLAAYENTGLTPEEIVDGQILTGWIVVSEGLPKEPECEGLIDFDEFDEYIVMIKGSEIPTTLVYAGDGDWQANGASYSVIAWMPLPEPYRENE